MVIHPRKNDKGQTVTILKPHLPSPLETWEDPLGIATVIPDGPVPKAVNGVTFGLPWLFPPGRDQWEQMGNDARFDEPPFEPNGLEPAAGAVVVEPDGRLWLVSPTNAFGGYKTTFPKGKAHGCGLRGTALKEVFEETGLFVELFGHLIDVDRTTSRTRYYLARRKGGSPAGMGWETQGVHLVPLEQAKGLLNKEVDHTVVNALLDRWGDWVWWFEHPEFKSPAWELAASGKEPARPWHWVHLPLPQARVRIALDVALSRAEAENLKLGFIPRMMEQKWFTYFEGDTLFEHRSWSGFCIDQVVFRQDGEGLRAVQALVSREPRQYGCRDDEEDRRLIETRIKQLANLTEEDRNAEDPFVGGLKAAMVPNYLGNPTVVLGLLEPYFKAILSHKLALLTGQPESHTFESNLKMNGALANIFSGENSDYATIGTWNTAGGLGALVVQTLDLDPDYYADENLFCILSEGLAGVSIAIGEMVGAFLKDPAADLKEDLLPCVAGLLHFTASVMMGTQPVLYPGLTLKSFQYVPRIDKEEEEELKLRTRRRVPATSSEETEEYEELLESIKVKMGRPITLPGPIGALAKKVGGVDKLAGEMGVSTRTIRRWAKGGVIPKLPLKVLWELCLLHDVDGMGLAPGQAKE